MQRHQSDAHLLWSGAALTMVLRARHRDNPFKTFNEGLVGRGKTRAVHGAVIAIGLDASVVLIGLGYHHVLKKIERTGRVGADK